MIGRFGLQQIEVLKNIETCLKLMVRKEDRVIRAKTAGFILFFFEQGEIMRSKYNDENEIYELLRSFEDATVSRDAWKHAEHLTVALCYLEKHDLATATDKMRSGIFKLLHAFNVDLSKEMPYHETLTVFWMRTVWEFNASKNGTSLLDKANEVVETFDKDYPLRFYSHDCLFSDEARRTYLDGDLRWRSVEKVQQVVPKAGFERTNKHGSD